MRHFWATIFFHLLIRVAHPLSIYPNPAQQEFFLIVNSAQNGNVEIAVINTNGQSVFSHSSGIGPGLSSFNIKSADWPSGTYLIKPPDGRPGTA